MPQVLFFLAGFSIPQFSTAQGIRSLLRRVICSKMTHPFWDDLTILSRRITINTKSYDPPVIGAYRN